MIVLSDLQIKDIAENLDIGLKCYVNKKTGNVIEIPDELRFGEIDQENWEDVIKELNENYDDYFEIDSIDTHDSFNIMHDFVEQISNNEIKQKFVYALDKPKPFKNFKYELDYHDEIREEWFKFKLNRIIDHVTNEIKKITKKDLL